jgi:hypothetical protein
MKSPVVRSGHSGFELEVITICIIIFAIVRYNKL